jgi:uncharacterized membrane protein
MKRMRRADVLIPAGLLVMCIVPAIGGAARLRQLTGGVATEDGARFSAMPWPAVVHIFAALIFSFLGALQFAPALMRRRRRWHRIAGRIALPAGFAVAISGLWMTQLYPRAGLDGPAVYWERLAAGVLMTAALWLAVSAIRKRAFAEHGAWMTRAYAIGMGAGTQVLTHVPLFVFPSIRGELSRAIAMGAAWAVNIVVAELWIRRGAAHHGSPFARAPLRRARA